MDSLTGRIWVDDCQVQKLEVEKFYQPKNTRPGLWLMVWTLEESNDADA